MPGLAGAVLHSQDSARACERALMQAWFSFSEQSSWDLHSPERAKDRLRSVEKPELEKRVCAYGEGGS